MAQLYEELKPKSKYYDRANYSSMEEYQNKLLDTATVYVGNLSFYTSQDAIFELFSRCGNVKDIKMGINDDGLPCGFCFVIFQNHEEARLAVEYLSHTKLWDRIIRVDWDPGYKEGREKGRGSGGQQKRDEYRNKEDAGRPMPQPQKKFHRDQPREGRNNWGRYPNREQNREWDRERSDRKQRDNRDNRQTDY